MIQMLQAGVHWGDDISSLCRRERNKITAQHEMAVVISRRSIQAAKGNSSGCPAVSFSQCHDKSEGEIKTQRGGETQRKLQLSSGRKVVALGATGKSIIKHL